MDEGFVDKFPHLFAGRLIGGQIVFVEAGDKDDGKFEAFGLVDGHNTNSVGRFVGVIEPAFGVIVLGDVSEKVEKIV